MAESKRQQVLDDVKTALESIDGTGSFETQARQVFDGFRPDPTDSTVDKFVGFTAGQETIQEEAHGPGPRILRVALQVDVHAVVRAARRDARKESDKLRADIQRALITDRRRGLSDGDVNTQLLANGPDNITPLEGELFLNEFSSSYAITWSHQEGTP